MEPTNGNKKKSSKKTNKSYFDVKGKFITKKLGDEVLKEFHIISLIDTSEMYVYQNGVYVSDGMIDRLKRHILRKLDKDFTKQRTSEVIEYLRLNTLITRDKINQNPLLINVINGIYDVEANKLLPHSSTYLSTIQLNVDYDPTAQCHNIDKFLFEVVKPDHVPLLVQYAGYCCVPDIRQQRALILDGGAWNGKSTFIDLICTMVGLKNTSQQSLQALNSDRFARAELNTKLINTYPDLPSKKLYDNSIFKLLTSDPYIDGEHKFGQKFRFKNTIHQIYSANKLPELDNPDEMAFFRRLIQVPFPNSFEGKADANLNEKLSKKEEISGFFNIAMIGLRALLKYNAFCENKTVEEKRTEYLAKSDPVQAFLNECADDSDDSWLKSEFRESLTKWCEINNVCRVSKEEEGKKMKTLGYRYRRMSFTPREYYWENISPKLGLCLDGTWTEAWTKNIEPIDSDNIDNNTLCPSVQGIYTLISKYKYMYYVYYIIGPFTLDAWTDEEKRNTETFEQFDQLSPSLDDLDGHASEHSQVDIANHLFSLKKDWGYSHRPKDPSGLLDTFVGEITGKFDLTRKSAERYVKDAYKVWGWPTY